MARNADTARDGGADAGPGPGTAPGGRTAGAALLELPGVLGNPGNPGRSAGGRRSGRSGRSGTAGGPGEPDTLGAEHHPGAGTAARTRLRAAPGSARHSVTLLVAVASVGVLLLGVTDGFAVALVGLAVAAAAGFCVTRYVAGAGARDGDYRRPVRLLGSSEPALGGWEWLVHNALGPDGEAYFAQRLRPHLQRLFAARLAARHGTDLHRAPERARALVGAELWPWIDPAEPPPRPSVPEGVLRALLERLEALGDPEQPADPGQPAPGDVPAPRTAPSTGTGTGTSTGTAS
ncbi:hypothetical protein [Streptomyces sp. NPDC087270]|uniref:hypothetical protein n=1 Tax=Streptomyces sp. NPDC087270 TaxID=3365774 RepID=UPI003813E305